jgi:hypothetical protein
VRGDDRVSILAVLVGATLAFIGYRQWVLLSSGVAMGIGGVILALRGDKPIDGRAWLRAAVLLGGIALVASLMLDLYSEWIAGQWFAEGSQPGDTAQQLRFVAKTSVGMRFVGLFFALAFLLGALVNRLRSGDERDSGNEKARR